MHCVLHLIEPLPELMPIDIVIAIAIGLLLTCNAAQWQRNATRNAIRYDTIRYDTMTHATNRNGHPNGIPSPIPSAAWPVACPSQSGRFAHSARRVGSERSVRFGRAQRIEWSRHRHRRAFPSFAQHTAKHSTEERYRQTGRETHAMPGTTLPFGQSTARRGVGRQCIWSAVA
jgi:hypothetical protein